MNAVVEPSLTLCRDIELADLQAVLGRYGLDIIVISGAAALPGSFWGDPEAGLIQNQLFIRPTTPLQSALHEACHYICMDTTRRTTLHTDAGGGYDEENGVCYLQILLADELPGMHRRQMMLDMDNWGYSFRLGSAQAWFEQDAEDARQWLLQHQLIDSQSRPTWRLRT